ncbi:hypothetical protein AMIS_31470 [Actinoplanes missouriensis 431]|uniref:DUF262 domain-containing protein n=1 Tax=Actinoplanes missouriensis (strain ATCC 14538 / DSM 43046 / CBS 188.64 / JCM 3121 / NBRC 102363 / NCIMB 12654 / NRRL B-3342 / UNCC 431) TaxID=512565 RepID=I0H5T0_ACTM4|nr:DUF262 domain-containing protein [Actinoplanes missouriensis]BAL88367.1 hypothetical protein AMIS_31470 [Actinoplanes missouriensis 431]
MPQLEAHEMPLHKVFCSDYSFSIPDYQRPYAWRKEQALQLLDDLSEALDRDSTEPYFLGSIVLVKDKQEPAVEVIDGQQRLTTLTILLAVLRDLADDDEVRSSLGQLISEPGDKILGLESRPRLALRKRDRAFFAHHIQRAGSVTHLRALKETAANTDAQRAVQENANALHGRLAQWQPHRRLDLMRMLSRRTYLVVVSTPDLASAHRIFSVMNARGLDLLPTDIFKSNIIGSLPPGDLDAYAEKWESAEELVGRELFAELFQHIRMIFAMKRPERELLKEFPEQVLASYLPGKGADFIDDVLTPYAEAYGQIRDFAYAAPVGAEKVNNWFRRLAQIDNGDWLPPALWALRRHGDDAAWLDDFFKALERLAASMLIRRVYATPRAQRYAALLRELTDGAGLDAPSLALSEAEKEEVAQKLNGDLYLQEKVRRYVLLRLDELLAQAPGVTYEHARITVEHVLPQNPAPASMWKVKFTDEQREYWTHRIANLVLLNRTKNSQARNFDFTKKKSAYFAGKNGVATFALTSQVLLQPQWTPEVLRARQSALLNVLKEAWLTN